jgi:alpha-methylacyl-CoA racemase
MPGVLEGLKIIEFEAIGPVPFCGMMLADHGASVTRILRPNDADEAASFVDMGMLLRNRSQSLVLDLKREKGDVLELIRAADGLIEGFRPGVMERLGLGPDVCHAANPRLVYGRISGYGQTGPLARNPGHDINYIAQTGALHALGESDRPPSPPLSLVGDFGGGGMLAAFGMLAGLLQAQRFGRGSVFDAAMCDGAALLMALTYSWSDRGKWTSTRASNLLDGGAPFYRCYRTQDDRYLALGAIEPKFYKAMREELGLHDALFDEQMNQKCWPEMTRRIAELIESRPLVEWQSAVERADACVSVVASIEEAASGHLAERGTLRREENAFVVASAPRFY